MTTVYICGLIFRPTALGRPARAWPSATERLMPEFAPVTNAGDPASIRAQGAARFCRLERDRSCQQIARGQVLVPEAAER